VTAQLEPLDVIALLKLRESAFAACSSVVILRLINLDLVQRYKGWAYELTAEGRRIADALYAVEVLSPPESSSFSFTTIDVSPLKGPNKP
jgi:hypothetical protein